MKLKEEGAAVEGTGTGGESTVNETIIVEDNTGISFLFIYFLD